MCGGELNLPENVFSGTCPYCKTLSTFPKVPDAQLSNLYNRAEQFRRSNDYDKAINAYESLLNTVTDDPELYWGLVLSKFGIEYVEDPLTHERIPTCHRVQIDSILADPDYLAALNNARTEQKYIYETEARRIADIQKNILAVSTQEEPFDVFICYKENDENGERTKDSVIAQDIYYALANSGLKVFFARITLEGKLGQQYEPYIFAALNSAKAMLVIGSKKEYFNAVWVRNEWSRYLALMKKDRSKLLIPCYKDMDAYDIPEELSMFQAQDVSKIGFIQDILHGLKKVAAKPQTPTAVPVAQVPVTGKNNPLLRRVQLFIESGDFNSARQYCEKVLDQDPENCWAYYYRLKAEMQTANDAKLLTINFANHSTFKLVQRFADEEMKGIIAQLMQQKALFEQQKATDRELRNQSIIRHNTMAEHLKMLSPSHKLAQMIQTQLAMEEQLYNNRNFLTENMVQGTMAASDKLLAMLDDYWKNVKMRNFIAWTFFFGLLFVGVMIGIFCSIE
jgi:tetratricopeptide (TPR) repeat protein